MVVVPQRLAARLAPGYVGDRRCSFARLDDRILAYRLV